MITAVDTNILLDLLTPDAPHAGESNRALAGAYQSGALVISEAVYTELFAHFVQQRDIERFLDQTSVRLQRSSQLVLERAGRAWRQYLRRRPPALVCPQCGTFNNVICDGCGSSLRPRQHLITDFWIGAHAATLADQLLTRDRGYYRTYFPELHLA